MLFWLLLKPKPQNFIVFFLLVLMLAPPFRVGNTYIALSYVCLIFPIVWILKLNKLGGLTLNFLSTIFLVINFIILLIFGFAWIVNGGLSVSGIIPFIGYTHIFLLILFLTIYINHYNKKGVEFLFEEFIIKLIILNAVAVFLQIVFPLLTTPLFFEMYWKPSLTVYQEHYDFLLMSGYNSRMFGLFSTPLSLGVTMLLCLAYYSSQLLYEYDRNKMIVTVLGLTIGISSLSKSFLIGLPVSFIVFIVVAIVLKINFFALKRLAVIVFLFPIIMFAAFGILLTTPLAGYAKFYFSFLLKPFKSLSMRYTANGSDLFLGKTYQVITDNPIFGVGPGSVSGEFIGDSGYVTVLHHAGILGLTLFFIFVIISFLILFKKKYFKQFMLLFTLIVTGLGVNNLFLNSIYIPFVIILMQYKQQTKISDAGTSSFI